MRHSLAIAALFASLALPAGLKAQGVSNVNKSAGDNGIKLGEGRLHPYADAETHFVLNPGRVAAQADQTDGYLTSRAGVDYDLGSPTLSLSFKGEGSYNLYFTRDDLSGFNAKVATKVEAWKGRPFEYRLNLGFIRSQMPANQTVLATVDHNDFTGGTGITVRPGGGALAISADFTAFYQDYDENENNRQTLGASPKDFNQLRLTPALRAGWKFLPKTSVFVDSKIDFTRYPAERVDTSAEPRNPESENIAIYAGLSGALTTRLSVEVKAGYINPRTDEENAANFGTPIGGEASVGYFLSSTSQLKLGFGRTATPQPIFGFVTQNEAFVSFDQQIGKVQLSLSGRAGQYDYGRQESQAAGTPNRADVGASASLAVTYAMTDWLSLGLSENFEWRNSNSEEVLLASESGLVDTPDFSYTFNDLFVTISMRY